MGSRIRCRKSLKKLFLCYMTIVPPWVNSKNSSTRDETDNGLTPIIKQVFPPSFKDPEVIKTAAQFVLPCVTHSGVVEVFTFVLTSGDSKWTFGYCRHPPSGGQTCTVFLSFIPWQEIFYRALNYCAELDDIALMCFLERMYNTPIPEAGTCLYIPTATKPFICPCPSDFSLPSIPENRNVSEFYNALSTESMLTLFAALLSERRIVVTSKKLSRLSSIVVAANLFLFPMSWQHIFIPILPTQLQDYMAAPMPFLIGVPLPVWNRIPAESLGQVVHVDADTDTVTTPFPEDLSSLPEDILVPLRKNLTGERVLGDGLARAFLRALAQLMGHYQDAIGEDGVSFDTDLFVQFSHPSHRYYIKEKLLGLQIFQQFVDERLEKVKAGSCESDEFELESLAWRSHSRSNGKNGLALKSIAGNQNKALKKAGKAVMMSVKRESGHLIESVKQNSALKSALRTVKESGKTVKQKSHIAYSDIKSKLHVGVPASHSSRSDHSRGHVSLSHTRPAITASVTNQSVAQGISDQFDTLFPDSNHEASGHLMSSCSASNLPRFNGNGVKAVEDEVHVMPRLSKSEENLIDLDTPSGIPGFTMDNPLYDLVTNNSVFEDDSKTDDQLLTEYGLNDYFAKLNIQLEPPVSRRASGFSGLSQQSSSNVTSSTDSSKWATFD